MTDEAHGPLEVTNNETAHRFETHVDGYVAMCVYHRDGNVITFTHTQVPAELAGQGVGSALVKTALEEARQHQLRVVPLCPFVAEYITHHQEYLDLVEPQYRERLKQS